MRSCGTPSTTSLRRSRRTASRRARSRWRSAHRPRDAVAAVDGLDRAARVDRSRDDDVGPVGVERVERRPRQPGQVEPGAAADHHGPARGAVGRGQRLEAPASRRGARRRARRGWPAGASGTHPAAFSSSSRSAGSRRAASISSARAGDGRRQRGHGVEDVGGVRVGVRTVLIGRSPMAAASAPRRRAVRAASSSQPPLQ